MGVDCQQGGCGIDCPALPSPFTLISMLVPFYIYTHLLPPLQSEIAAVLSVGASPDQVLYANAIKAPSHLRYATERGVRAMTFDCESELLKIREHAPDARSVGGALVGRYLHYWWVGTW